MSNPTLVSVILPTYNRARLVPRAIESVLQQTHEAIELIVVDDGSTDDTENAVRSFDDSRIRYVRHDNRRGAAAARNTGIELARGEYVAFQDSDDEWLPDKTAVQLQALEKPGLGDAVCVCSYRHYKHERWKPVIHPPGVKRGDVVIAELLGGMALGTQTLLVKKRLVDEAGGFDERLPRAQDYDLCIRLAARSDFLLLSEALVDVHHNEDSISADPFLFADATRMLAEKHASLWSQHPKGYSKQLFRSGLYFALDGHYRSAIRQLWKAITVNPLNWKAVVLLTGIVTGLFPAGRALKS